MFYHHVLVECVANTPQRALPCHWVRTAVAVVDVFQIESMDVTREVSMSISRLFHTSQTSKDG